MTGKEIEDQFEFQGIWEKMTSEEQARLSLLGLAGFHQRNDDGSTTVYTGSESIARINFYKIEMITKYGKLKIPEL